MAYLKDLIEASKKKGVKKTTESAKSEISELREELSKSRIAAARSEEEAFEQAEKTFIEQSGEAKIYQIAGEPLLYYVVEKSTLNPEEQKIISVLKEAATRIIAIQPHEIKDPQERHRIYLNKVYEIIDAAPELKIPKNRRSYYAEAVVNEMLGYGPIDPLIKDDNLEEIMVIAPGKPVYVFHRRLEMLRTNIVFYDEKTLRDLIDKIARSVGRRLDVADPFLDARLPDGSRVNATLPPISVDGMTLTIRKFRKDPYSIIDLINLNTVNIDVAAFLWLAMDGMGVKPANILVSGGTGSGKTTTLNVLASMIPQTERIISIEETAELQLPLKQWIRFETRPPSLEGTHEVDMNALVINSLRMRPDRIIVGEIRGKEAYNLFTAMNTGHDGSMGTVHANSAEETKVRVTTPPMNVPEGMLRALDLILVEQRIHDRRKGTIRRITEIAEIVPTVEGKTEINTIYQWNGAKDVLESTGLPSRYLEKIKQYTDISTNEITAELEKRKSILKKMQLDNTRSIKDTAKVMQKYVFDNFYRKKVM